MILAFTLESFPWCYLVVGILLLGFEPEIHSTYFMLIVIASSLRLLVTFAIVLEVRGIFFFQIPWTTYGRSSSLNWTITTRVLLMSSPLYIVTLPVQPFRIGYPEETCWALLNILIYASTTQKIICSFELSLFSCLLTFVYQLISRVCIHSFIDAYYPCGPSSHSVLNDLEKQTPVPHPYLGLGQSSCIPQIKCQSSFWFCSTLEYYHLYIGIVIGIAHHPMNSWYSDTSCHHCSFLGSCVIATEIPTNELWCVKSILLATLLLGS